MKKYSLSLLILSGLLLGGCTQWVWVKNGEPVSGVEFDSDSLDCKTHAGRLFPYAGVSVVTQPAHVIPPSPPRRVCEQAGAGGQCTGQRHALLLSARQLVGVACLHALQAHQRQHLGHAAGAFCLRQVVDANGASRNDYWHTCMGSKGWSQVDAKTVERDRPVVYIEKPADPPAPVETPPNKKVPVPAKKR
mgnify:CR=1 FL=1